MFRVRIMKISVGRQVIADMVTDVVKTEGCTVLHLG